MSYDWRRGCGVSANPSPGTIVAFPFLSIGPGNFQRGLVDTLKSRLLRYLPLETPSKWPLLQATPPTSPLTAVLAFSFTRLVPGYHGCFPRSGLVTSFAVLPTAIAYGAAARTLLVCQVETQTSRDSIRALTPKHQWRRPPSGAIHS